MNSFWFPAKSTHCVRIISKKLREITDDIGDIAEDTQDILEDGLELVRDMATLELSEIKDDLEDIAEDFDDLAESITEIKDDIVDLVTLNDQEEETKSTTHDSMILLAEIFESATAYRAWEREARVPQLKELCTKINVDNEGPGREVKKRLRAISTQLPL
jgi:methyl-accepting chemotaxis protein